MSYFVAFIYSAAEHADAIKQVTAADPDIQSLEPSHGQSHKSPELRAFPDSVTVFDIGDDILGKVHSKGIFHSVHPRGMSIGHNHNHRNRFFFSDQVIEDHIGPADCTPSPLVVPCAV